MKRTELFLRGMWYPWQLDPERKRGEENRFCTGASQLNNVVQKQQKKMVCAVAILAVVLCVLHVAHTKSFQVKERLIHRESLLKKERSPERHVHEVVVSIRKRNMERIKALAMERATPGNPFYQKWLSVSEVDQIVSNAEASERVQTWLSTIEEATVVKISRRKDYIRVAAPIAIWERELNTHFYIFEDHSSPGNVHTVHRALNYSIPAHLDDDIHAIFNTVHTPHIIGNRHLASGGLAYKTDIGSEATADGTVTVAFLRHFYKIDDSIGSAALSQSVFETNHEYFSPSDLLLFQQINGLQEQPALSVGDRQTTSCGAENFRCHEGNLDIQYIMGVAQATTSVFWFVPADSDPFVTFLTDIADSASPPSSNSISWGSIEQFTLPSTLEAFDNEAAILASLGISVTVSVGDDGAASSSSGQCRCNENSDSTISSWGGSESWSGMGYFPFFPASSPWITAVGATQGPQLGEEEVACQSQLGGVITSGGGFSTYYPTPSWQEEAVSRYFEALPAEERPSDGYNPHGRAYPDVSLLGVNYQVVLDGNVVGLYGSSASAPVFAAIISLVNARRLAKNMPTIGFINPTLYRAGAMYYSDYDSQDGSPFNDITSGHNRCCSISGSRGQSIWKRVDVRYRREEVSCCTSGFACTRGWDPVSGWGSIDYPNFAALFDV